MSTPWSLDEMVVTIVGVEGDTVMVRDSYNTEMQVDLSLRAKALGTPTPDEHWVITKKMGRWVLDTMIDAPPPPEVTGEREGLHPVIEQLLDAMAQHGLIIDATVRPESSVIGGEVVLDDDNDPYTPPDPTDPEAEEPYLPPEEEPFEPGPRDDDEDEEPNRPPQKDPEETWSTVTVVTYNQKFAMGARRAKSDLMRLRQTRMDVGLLQEVHPDDRDYVFTDMSGNWGVHRPAGHAATNTIIWRKATMEYIASGTVQIDTSDGPGTYRPSRHVNWVRLRHRESKMVATYLSTHLDNAAAPYGVLRQNVHTARFLRQVAALPGIVRTHSQHGPVFFGGDFNVDWRDDRRHRDPRLPYVRLRSVNMAASYEKFGQPAVGTIGTHGTTFDHLYLRHKVPGQVKATYQKILRGYYSDHRPLMVTYRVRNRTKRRQ